MRKAPLIVAGLIFSVIGILNLARSIWGIPIRVDKIITLEPWTGILAFIIMSLLAIWMFSSLRRDDTKQLK
jgi:cytosine/uracil/thiamine/allantoin permease